MSVRLSVNLAPGVARTFKSTAAGLGMSVTEATRRAIGLWKLLVDAQERGARIVITDRRGRVRKEVHLP